MIETYIDWKIHRKLDEACRIYIYPARGSGKSQIEQILNLIDSGKDVYVMTKADYSKRLPSIEQIKETILDWDLQGVSSWCVGFQDEFREGLKAHYRLDKPCDKDRHMWIRTINPYGRSWFI